MYSQGNSTLSKLHLFNRLHYLFFLSACLKLSAVHSQDVEGRQSDDLAGNTAIFRYGLAVIDQPAYLGAHERTTSALPLLSVSWSNGLSIGVDGLGYRFPTHGNMSYGLKLSWDKGRPEGDSSALKGLGSIDARPTIGGYFDYKLSHPVILSSSIKYGSGNDRNGAVLDLGVKSRLPIASNHRVTFGLGFSIANQEAMQSEFGITDRQSRNSGYKNFTPSAGLRSINVSANYGYSIFSNTTLNAGINAWQLMGDSRESPISKNLDGVGVSLMLLKTY
jgi:outer membrane protein